MGLVPDKKDLIIFVLLCVIALGLGYWYGLPDKPSEEKAEAGTPPAPEKLINDPIVEKAIHIKHGHTRELTKADLEKVTRLTLGGTQITDAGLKEVAKMQNLTHLYLDVTKITDAGLKDIAKMQNLTVLKLYNTKITDAGLAQLKKALPKCEISHSYKKD